MPKAPTSYINASTSRTATASDNLMDDDTEDLRLDEAETNVWLVKVPLFLADRWRNIDQEKQDLGKVRIYDTPDPEGNTLSIILSDDPQHKDIPQEYKLRVVNNQVDNLYVFSENEDNHATALRGVVHHECSATPVYNDVYRSIMHQRMAQADKGNRKVQFMTERDRRSLMAPEMQESGNMVRKRAIDLDSRSARMERSVLMDKIFRCFEEHPYWAMKGFVEVTGQPVAYLKEILDEVATFHRKGSYSQTYSLKPEYSNRAQAPSVDQTSPDETSGNQDKFESDDDFEEV
ncbi:hypothetical protein IWQ61_004104 [Dispira simplex]|nr:hypothetical protein IWQ61_004104 [Dispira simplex]